MDRTVRRRLLAAGILLLAAGALLLAALLGGSWFYRFYPAVSRACMSALAAVTGLVPFAVCEAALYGLIVWAIVSLVRALRRRRPGRWLSGLALGLAIALAGFLSLWGLGHFGPTLDARLGLQVQPSSQQELEQAASYFLQGAAEAGAGLPRAQDGGTQMLDFSSLAARANDGYEALAAQSSLFSGSGAPVKRVLAWPALSYFGVTGIFVCLTGESCVNPDTFRVSLPFTMCHELAHRRAITRENEANFMAFLACLASPDPYYQYSGYYSAFVYCYNALYRIDRAAAFALLEDAPDFLLADLAAAQAHYARYEGPVQTAAQTVNDTYLKVFQSESGVASYGEVTDLLLAWWREEKNS